MRLTVVGCAGSFPGPDSPASSYLVQAEDAAGRTWSVVLDLGSGALGGLQRFLDPRALDAVAISHLHPDHFADLCGLYVYLRYHPGGEQASAGPGVGPDAESGPAPGPTRGLPVLAPAAAPGRIAQAYGPGPQEDLTALYDHRAWDAGTAVRIGPLTLTPVRVEHPVEAYGIRVSGPSEEDPRRTVTLAYTGDTDSCPGLDELAGGAALLLSEAAFVEGRDEARGIHLTGRRAGLAAARAGVERLVLTHIPAWNDARVAAREASEVYDGPIEVAEQGAVFVL